MPSSRELAETLKGVTEKEKDAQRIEIECVEPPGGGADGYIVTVYPKEGKPGTKEKHNGWMRPIKRVFESKQSAIGYVMKVL